MTVVIVILSIVASIGSSFVVSALDSYRATHVRQILAQRARLTLEQMSRELRAAVPNSVRLSSSKQCIEFMPVVAAANYLDDLPTTANAKSAVNSIATAPVDMDLSDAVYLVVAPFSSGELYSNGSPSVRAKLGSLGSAPYSNFNLATATTFVRNSSQHRLYLASSPLRYCVTDDVLWRYSNYTLSSQVVTDTDPGGTADRMSHGVTPDGNAFEISPGSEDRNTTVIMNLQFNNASQALVLQHQVAIRNVP